MPHSTPTVGNVEITILHDAEVALPFSRTFPDVPPEAWTPYLKRYPDAYTKTASSDDSLRVHFECYLVRSQGRTLLVDTGLGSANSNPNVVANIGGGVDGVLLKELEAAGVQAGDIDTVFLTHLHPDHVGWNVSRVDGTTMSLQPSQTPATWLTRPTGPPIKRPETQKSSATTGGSKRLPRCTAWAF